MSHRRRSSRGGSSRSRSRSAQRSQSRNRSRSRARSRSRGAQRSQSKRRSQQRTQQREQRANVREQARSAPQRAAQRAAKARAAAPSYLAGLQAAGGLSGTQGAGAGQANRLANEYGQKGTTDAIKREIAKELNNVRRQLNVDNRKRSYDNLLNASKTNKGLVMRTSDGSIVRDSSGNPILSSAGKDVFDQTRQGYSNRSEYLRQTNPELYGKMYPVASAATNLLPKAMQAVIPGGTILKNIAKSALGKAQDVGSGIMGSKIGQNIAAAPRGFFGDLRNMAGNIFGGLGNFIPGGRTGDSIQAERSSGGGGGGDRGGVIDAAQSVVDNIYGTRIGVTGPVTADFRDSDGDGIDDRYQTGPGMKYQGPAIDPTQLKKPNPFDSSFQVVLPVVSQPFEQFNRGTPFNYSVSPLSNQYTQRGIADPNLAQYYQNLNLFPRVV